MTTLPSYKRATAAILEREYRRLSVLPYQPDLLSVIRDPMLWNHGLLQYREMGRDDMVEHALTLVIASILQDVRAVPAGDTAECAMAQRLLEEALIKAVPDGLINKLFNVALALFFGFSVNEPEAGFIDHGEFRGWTKMEDVHYLQPYFIDFETDEEGALIHLIQRDPTTGEERKLSPDEAVYCVFREDVDPFRGQSMFRPSYPHWHFKQGVFRLRAIQTERAAGKGVAEQEDRFEGTKTEYETQAGDILDEYQNAAGIVLPKGIKLSILQGELDPNRLTELITDANKGIVRPTGIAWLAIEEGLKTGSYALGKVHAETTLRKQKFPKEAFEQLANRTLVKWVYDWNWIRPEHRATLTFSPETEEDKQGRLTLFNSSVQVGTIKHRGLPDEQWGRQLVGAPQVSDEDAAEEREGPADFEASEIFSKKKVEKFAVGDERWWEAPLTIRERRVDFARINKGLDEIVARDRQALDRLWKRAIERFREEARLWLQDPSIRPADIFQRVRDARLDLQGFEDHLTGSQIEVFLFGQEQAAREIEKAQAGAAIARFSFSQYEGLTDEEMDELGAAMRKARRELQSVADSVFDYDRTPSSFRGSSLRLAEDLYLHGGSPTQVAMAQPPIRVDFDTADGRIYLVDGRHRLISAQIYGAQSLRAQVRVITPFGIQYYDAGPVVVGLKSNKAGARALADSVYGVEARKDPGFEGAPDRSLATAEPEIPAQPEPPATVLGSPGVDPHGLGDFQDLAKSKSFRVRRGFEQEALNDVADSLQTAFDEGMPLDEAIAELDYALDQAATQKLIEPGTPGYDYTSPSVQETTVRTMHNNSFGAGRANVYRAYPEFVQGIERSEVAEGRDGKRSHPLSRWVHGIKIRLSDPRSRKFEKALHYNDRGLAIPVTLTDGDVEWSSEHEIQRAIRKIEDLGF